MPTESRILGFNKHEVFEVLREYCTQTGRIVPEEDFDDMTLVQGTEVRVELKLNGERPTLEFTEGELGAAIIMWCIKRGIPMARHAMKSLEVVHEKLLLHLRIRP